MISDVSGSCSFCGTDCKSFSDCKKKEQFALIVENAQKMALLKKHIKVSAPQFKGNTKWFTQPCNHFVERKFDESTEWKYRFLTVTFDPKKFTLNQLTDVPALINYFHNAIYDLRYLFKDNPIIILEFHKSGIPHFHINYNVDGVLELNTLLLRLKYYFSKDLRTKHCIHDRLFNINGQSYMKKSNDKYFQFKVWEKPLEKSLQIIF